MSLLVRNVLHASRIFVHAHRERTCATRELELSASPRAGPHGGFTGSSAARCPRRTRVRVQGAWRRARAAARKSPAVHAPPPENECISENINDHTDLSKLVLVPFGACGLDIDSGKGRDVLSGLRNACCLGEMSQEFEGSGISTALHTRIPTEHAATYKSTFGENGFYPNASERVRTPEPVSQNCCPNPACNVTVTQQFSFCSIYMQCQWLSVSTFCAGPSTSKHIDARIAELDDLEYDAAEALSADD
ncbi:hypothetical protein C8R45DRAFT_947814 [Mycena sanguinolenta]|nr:hypothetical protein C8R45DRAFT_947814 [Mycena sanguinolenta]